MKSKTDNRSALWRSGHSGSPDSRHFSLFSKPLSKTLAQVVKPVFKKHGFAEHRLLTEWHLVVGADMAAYCLPQKLSLPRGKTEGGTLHLLVAPARALELQHMQPQVLDKIATYFGYKAVLKLSFTQGSPALFRRKAKTAPAAAPAPDAALTALVASCEDERLQRALLSLGAALAAVEK